MAASKTGYPAVSLLLVSAAGAVVATYAYDAWGKILDIREFSEYTIGRLNPIRYRGYYYDVETGYYYCQSRYYNPAWCRWISADVYMDTGDGILGTNMYAYCQGDPVNFADPSGHAIDRSKFAFLANLIGIRKDENGIYHASQNWIQKPFGYNDLYDWAFDTVTEAFFAKFPFKSGEKSYIVWLWKGDYLNLGAGAEIGLYSAKASKDIFAEDEDVLWQAHNGVSTINTLTLKYNRSGHKNDGKTIFTYAPGTAQWWTTGFNPSWQRVNKNHLSAFGTMDFSAHHQMYIDFRNTWKGQSLQKGVTLDFNDTLYLVTMTW